MILRESDVEGLDFAKGDGLLPAVVQDAQGGALLMVGYMNAEALRETLRRKRVVFWSRSKGRLWEKGETSGNCLELVEVRADCDADALRVLARPAGPVCHLGTATCFGDGPAFAGGPATDAGRLQFLAKLERIIESRVTSASPEGGSYTARLFAAGPRRMAQKVGEEGVEVALAGACEATDKLVGEAADLLFHLTVLLKARGLGLPDVVAELERRHAARS